MEEKPGTVADDMPPPRPKMRTVYMISVHMVLFPLIGLSLTCNDSFGSLFFGEIGNFRLMESLGEFGEELLVEFDLFFILGVGKFGEEWGHGGSISDYKRLASKVVLVFPAYEVFAPCLELDELWVLSQFFLRPGFLLFVQVLACHRQEEVVAHPIDAFLCQVSEVFHNDIDIGFMEIGGKRDDDMGLCEIGQFSVQIVFIADSFRDCFEPLSITVALNHLAVNKFRVVHCSSFNWIKFVFTLLP